MSYRNITKAKQTAVRVELDENVSDSSSDDFTDSRDGCFRNDEETHSEKTSEDEDEPMQGENDPLKISLDDLWKKLADGRSLKKFKIGDSSPYGYYSLFFTDNVLELIVAETNRKANCNNISRDPRGKKPPTWKNTDIEEIKKFLGIIMYMGLVKYPSIEKYWSKDLLYSNKFVPRIMSRNRFQMLLRFIHFANDDQSNETSSKLYKVDALVDEMNTSFKRIQSPISDAIIDESIISFHGRCQYILGKTHRDYIKMSKLTDPTGYTYHVKIYSGNELQSTENSTSSNTGLIYKKCKKGIDLSDQLASHFSPLRKTIRWFHRAVFELLLNIAVVNAYLLYNNDNTNKRIQILDFRKEIIMSLTDSSNIITPIKPSTAKHILQKNNQRTSDNRRKRSRCTECYKRLLAESGAEYARKKCKQVDTICDKCDPKAFLCLEHFQEIH